MKKENSGGRKFRRVSPDRVASAADLAPGNTKVRITIMLDLDVLNYFKERAKLPNAAPYQTQINEELRRVMKRQPRMSARDALIVLSELVAEAEA